MTLRLQLSTLCLAAALAACGDDAVSPSGLLLNQPTAVATFRGVTTLRPGIHPYLAVANGGGNDLTILDAVTDAMVPAPLVFRPLVFPVRTGRPDLLASADLGDGGADLLVAVSAGDSRLQLFRTWQADGDVVAQVELGGDVLALAAIPIAFVPPNAPTARIAAALSDGRVAVAEFTRSIPDDPLSGIDPTGVVSTGTFGFQPIALAAMPGDETVVYAATLDPIFDPSTATTSSGVAEIDIAQMTAAALDARAPTRLVAAARLWERTPGSTALDASAFDVTVPPVRRVYAVLDESGCGLSHPIACGLVALDPVTRSLVPDPTLAASTTFRAPIPFPGSALALGTTPPPENPPSSLEPQFAGTYMRMPTTAAPTRATTAAGGVAAGDGAIYFVDLGRWEIPGDQGVKPGFTKTSTDSALAAGVTVGVTAGYTPTVKWTATFRGDLPGLVSHRAALLDARQLALQAGGGSSEVVRVFDATLGVHPDDRVLIADPTGVGSCAAFEVRIAALVAPDAPSLPSAAPGGALEIDPDPEGCATLASVARKELRATIRAGGWVLVRGTGASAVQAGRPTPGVPLAVQWQDETAVSCPVWPATCGTWALDAACRTQCEDLLRRRLGRRIGYVPADGDPIGPALELTLPSGVSETPGRAVVVDTTEGRIPFRAVDSAGFGIAPRSVVPFDRSRFPGLDPNAPAGGVRFFVPYASGVVLDATPTIGGGNANALR